MATLELAHHSNLQIFKQNNSKRLSATSYLVKLIQEERLTRPELNRLLETLKSGDTLTVTKLERLVGNTREVLHLVNSLFERNINVHILNIGLIDNTPTGKLIFTVLSAFAEFEVVIIKSRMQESKEYAKMQKGYKEGRPQKYSDEKRKLAISLLKRHTYKEVEKMTGISVSTLQRINKTKIPFSEHTPLE